MLHLQDNGYQILEKNWRHGRGELDIIAQNGAELVFVEVKTRKGENAGIPLDQITDKKADQLLSLAAAYVEVKDLDNSWRIDVITVELDATGKFLKLDQIEDAVLGW